VGSEIQEVHGAADCETVIVISERRLYSLAVRIDSERFVLVIEILVCVERIVTNELEQHSVELDHRRCGSRR
jgi:hypothetical protein